MEKRNRSKGGVAIDTSEELSSKKHQDEKEYEFYKEKKFAKLSNEESVKAELKIRFGKNLPSKED